MISEVNPEMVREWLGALHTQYQLQGDAIIPRVSSEAPTVEQLGKIREAHLSIIPTLNAYLQLQTKLEQLRAEREWRDISTAPRDGRWFLACKYVDNSLKTAAINTPIVGLTFLPVADTYDICQVRWDGDLEKYIDIFSDEFSHDYFQFWMPLPNPPTQTKQKEEQDASD